MASVVAVSLILACCLPACSGGDTRKRAPDDGADRLQVELRAIGDHAESLSEERFEDIVRRQVAARLPGAKDHRVRLVAGVRSEDGVARINIEASLRIHGVALATVVSASGSAESGAALERLLANGARDAAAGLAEQRRVLEGGRRAWLAALTAAEADVQLLGLRLLGEAKDAAAVPEVAELLDDPREPVTEAAASTLGVIGDEKAVPLLIEAARVGDLRAEVRTLEALAEIGGSEARSYLEMVALGHHVPEVRSLAGDLLARATSRRKK